MPILTCPNCNGGMNEITRNDVSIDVCPKCKGVWLDDGELQKLLTPVRELKRDMDDERRYYEQPRQQHAPQHQQPHHYRDDDDSYKYGHGKYRKKKSMLDMFDIFD